MFACETQILRQLAVLVMCHGLTVGQIMSQHFLVQRALSWHQAREFCQRHYVDLAVLSTEEQYFSLLNATAAEKVSFWLGLQRQSTYSIWKWVDGQELSYDHWYRENYEARCASLETVLQKDKLLARYCVEPHRSVCQGPVSPQEVTVDSVGTDHVTLTWNVSAFMQMTPHSYTVTACTTICDTFFYPYTPGSTSTTISISNLTSGTELFIGVAASVVRPDNMTGENVTHQSGFTTVKVKTALPGPQYKVRVTLLKLFKLLSLGPPLWVLYRILKKDATKLSNPEPFSEDFSTEDTIVELIPEEEGGK
ncbi:uncharacterized protein LOC115364979 [Myripristis murdjan]|uniref:uncharacterized protein LOC115364979 n=1 Tax=Myripristis murdjan TaxID=586833 RepID=UPI001175DDCB|nr:uncharacterized protein LOC115364979 [Myripristis murdjan]